MLNAGDNFFSEGNLHLEGNLHIKIGNNVRIDKNSSLTAWTQYYDSTFTPSIVLGNNVAIGESAHITSINSIILGDGVLLGKHVTISDNSHGSITCEDALIEPKFRKLVSKGPVIVEKNVWIGDKVTILSGVHIGEGAIIGANSVVTRDIPAYSVACGVPCRVVKLIK
jgi:acetyltransferase-like isoleucine patch superfamily enzyme